MNKNIKKTLISCLYGITLSANIVMCCEKGNLSLILNSDQDPSLNINEVLGYITNQNFNNQPNTEQIDANPETKKRKITEITNLLNPDDSFFNKESDKIQKIENEYTKIDFSLIDTDDKYANIYSKILGGKKALVTIKCDVCNLEINSPLGEARNSILAHRLTQHIEQYPSKPNKNRKKEVSNTQNKTGYIELDFSAIDTEQKYNDTAKNLPYRKQTPVIIKCPEPECTSTRSGNLSNARRNLLDHRWDFHGIEYLKIKPVKTEYTELDFSYTKLDFSSINTNQKYNKWADEHGGKQQLVSITCPNPTCSTERNGKLFHVVPSIKSHIKEKHPDFLLE